MSSRPNTPYRPRLCSHDVSKTDMERQTPDTRHQAPYIWDTCLCYYMLQTPASDTSWHKDSGSFPPEVSETAAWNLMEYQVRYDEVLQWASLTLVSHLLSRRHTSVLKHVARLDDDTPANMALQLHINVSLNRPPDHTWGHPQNKWLDQLWNDSTRPIGDLWRCAVGRGHGGVTTWWPSPATWRWWITVPKITLNGQLLLMLSVEVGGILFCNAV